MRGACLVALFGLIRPLKHTLDAHNHNLPQEVWSMIETYLGAHGAVLAADQDLMHPYLE